MSTPLDGGERERPARIEDEKVTELVEAVRDSGIAYGVAGPSCRDIQGAGDEMEAAENALHEYIAALRSAAPKSEPCSNSRAECFRCGARLGCWRMIDGLEHEMRHGDAMRLELGVEAAGAAPRSTPDAPSSAIALIAAERARQITVEGWTPDHDEKHRDEELAAAASCYAMPAECRRLDEGIPVAWPWSDGWWKPTPNDRVRELVKAGALIVAEIERLSPSLRVAATPLDVQEAAPASQTIEAERCGGLLDCKLPAHHEGRCVPRNPLPPGPPAGPNICHKPIPRSLDRCLLKPHHEGDCAAPRRDWA